MEVRRNILRPGCLVDGALKGFFRRDVHLVPVQPFGPAGEDHLVHPFGGKPFCQAVVKDKVLGCKAEVAFNIPVAAENKPGNISEEHFRAKHLP